MTKLPEGFSRFGDRIALAVCVLLSLWAISLDEPSRVEIGTRLAHRVFSPVEWSTRFLYDLGSLRAENDYLRGRITAMELDAVQIEAERLRIEELKAQAGFYERNRGHLAPASVLELNVSRIPVQATIRCFLTEDSLVIWQPVVTEAGLVGRISNVLSETDALVELLTEGDARISVESMESGVTGLLRFDGRNFLVDHVPQGDPISAGDRIITSGLGRTVPRGIPVGVVRRVISSQVDLFQRIEVEANVKFSALSRVYVITRDGPWYSRRGDSLVPDDQALPAEEEQP